MIGPRIPQPRHVPGPEEEEEEEIGVGGIGGRALRLKEEVNGKELKNRVCMDVFVRFSFLSLQIKDRVIVFLLLLCPSLPSFSFFASFSSFLLSLSILSFFPSFIF